jgi:hypothetical protein
LLIALVKMSQRNHSNPFLALTNKKMSKYEQARGHNRADSQIRCVHDEDVAYGKQERCGLDESSSSLLQPR